MVNASNDLPVKLKKEPLIEAVFEIRFNSSSPISNILPGLLFSKLTFQDKKLDRLGAAELPAQLREADPNLQFAPLLKVNWNQSFILVGDRSFGLGCNFPYQGWHSFKQAILEASAVLRDSGFVDSIQRYSLKYVDLVERNSLSDQLASINFSIEVGGHHIKHENTQLRVEIPREDLLHVVQVISNVTAVSANGIKRYGVVVDVDTHADAASLKIDDFWTHLSSNLDAIHLANKKMFFDCLTPQTLTELEPIYEL